MATYYYDDNAAVAAVLGVIILVTVLIAIVGYVITALFLMKIFEKAGVQGKWRAWIPVYNSMIFLKLGDLSPWLILYAIGAGILLGWIPVIGWLVGIAAAVPMILAAYRVGQKLQKEGAWVVLYIFLSIVWLGINAFDKSRWNQNIPPAPWAGNAFFGDRTVWEGVPVQTSAAPAQGVPGYGAAPQGYAAPQNYAPPAAPGSAPSGPGYGAPGYAAPGTAAPATPPTPPPATGAPSASDPSVPSTPPPATPPTPPPAAPPAPPTAPPAPPTRPSDQENPPV